MHNVLSNPNHIPSWEEFITQQKEHKKTLAEQEQKAHILLQELQITPQEAAKRPDILSVDPKNTNEVIAYIARQNLACAFGCCADDDTPERVAEIINILQKNTDGKYIHLGLYEIDAEKWSAIKLQNPQYASQYFEVSLSENPQDNAEKSKILQEFEEIYNLKQNA